MEETNIKIDLENINVSIDPDETIDDENAQGSTTDDDESNADDEESNADSERLFESLCKPEQLMTALNKLKNMPPDFVIDFQLLNAPLIAIANTNNNDQTQDRITFPIYERTNWNSLEMKADDIQILNPTWIDYLDNYIVPQIKWKMVLDFELKAYLKSFWIVESSSAVTSLCDSDLDENTVATLIIQLPSNYEGGHHWINPKIDNYHIYGKYVDLSTLSNAELEFSPSCIVFHRDYKHEMKPITKGIAAFLVYNLMPVNSSNMIYVPKTPDSEDRDNEWMLRGLLSEWKDPGKLIIGLSNEYTKENLSLENLKSTDLAMAMQLKRQSEFMNDFSSYEIFVGFLNRIFHGEVYGTDSKFNSKDPSNILQTDYNIECLKHIDGKKLIHFKHFDVNFDDEVWPIDCFNGVECYRCSRDHSRNWVDTDSFMDSDLDEDEFHVTKYYRRPVLVIIKRYNFIEELKKSLVDVGDIYKIFIALHQEYKEKPVDKYIGNDRIRRMFSNWSWTVSLMSLSKCRQDTNHSKKLTISLVKTLISLGDIDSRRIEKYFESNQTLTEEIVPLLISQCDKHGWLTFSQTLCSMFKQTNTFSRAQKYFQFFIDSGDSSTEPDKRSVLQSVFNVILDNEKGRYHRDFNEFFRSVWNLAKKGGLDLKEYGKTQNINNIVPFLIELAECDANNKTDDNWLDLANHFQIKMKSLFTNRPESNWRRTGVNISGNCDCIQNLVIFLQDDLQSNTFNLSKVHRNHFKSVIDRLPHITYIISEKSANIVVIKTRKCGQDRLLAYERNLKLLTKLNSICEGG